MEKAEMAKQFEELKKDLLKEIRTQLVETTRKDIQELVQHLKVELKKNLIATIREVTSEDKQILTQQIKEEVKSELIPTMEEVAREEIQKILDTSLDTEGLRLFDIMEARVASMEERYDVLSDQLEKIDESQQFFSKKFDDQKGKNEHLDSLSKNVHVMGEALMQVKNQVAECSTNTEKMDQLSRQQSLEFHGIPQKPNEDTSALVIELVFELMDIEITPRDISSSYRLPASKNPDILGFSKKTNNMIPADEPTNPRPILVVFSNKQFRDEIYQQRTALKGKRSIKVEGTKNLFINENLTKCRRELFHSVRAKAKKQETKHSQILTTNGNIFVRKSINSKKLPIRSAEDLKKMI